MRKKDIIYNVITYMASAISCIILGAILIFVFQRGIKVLNFDLLRNDYWSKNYLVAVVNDKAGNFVKPDSIAAEQFSSKWGIAVDDYVTSSKDKVIRVTYIDANSPFKEVVSTTAGESEGKKINFDVGYTIEKIDSKDASGNILLSGKILGSDSKAIIQTLEKSESVSSMYIKSAGGGIRSSLVATFYLILISLSISLPIGISSAIYLHEYASKTRMNALIRQGIEVLTGVPSIIYGLMGITVLFPVTALFGAKTTSVLLGGLTMSVILLPTIIRSTEEALIVVPKGLRDGSLSLGATKSQTIFKVVLPSCINGILTGVLLSIGRVIGESAALIYTMGTFINDSVTLLGQSTSLSLMIWSFMSSENPNFELASAISLIILIFVLGLNIIVKIIGKRLNKSFG